eukprot:TRINITY_DN3233_c0_g1_i1.p2 TRINITY_DN3233_c0_g1~~TRINITY_DN3233_c0_g1_i1.p2  ORF type:complete len:238 (+),score=30.74 TRINITY_DN3233_c0_g1_i1:144-857(+)
MQVSATPDFLCAVQDDNNNNNIQCLQNQQEILQLRNLQQNHQQHQQNYKINSNQKQQISLLQTTPEKNILRCVGNSNVVFNCATEKAQKITKNFENADQICTLNGILQGRCDQYCNNNDNIIFLNGILEGQSDKRNNKDDNQDFYNGFLQGHGDLQQNNGYIQFDQNGNQQEQNEEQNIKKISNELYQKQNQQCVYIPETEDVWDENGYRQILQQKHDDSQFWQGLQDDDDDDDDFD